MKTLYAPLGAHEQLAQYEVLEELGTGGMGRVFKARNRLTDHLVALKLSRHEHATSSEESSKIARLLEKEARVLAHLQHPNIARFLGFQRDADCDVLVMEYVEGCTLKELVLQEGPMPWRDVLALSLPLLDALAYVHSLGIIHRDIKPSNLMFCHNADGKQTLKLLDLGLAKVTRRLSEDEGASFFETDYQTSQSVRGTWQYLSPEHIQGSQYVVPASDLYSLGCTLFHLLTGRAPFVEAQQCAYWYAHLCKAPPGLAQFCPDLPRPLIDLVNRLLSKNPAARGDVQSVTAEIQRILQADQQRGQRPQRGFIDREPLGERAIVVLKLIMRAFGELYTPRNRTSP